MADANYDDALFIRATGHLGNGRWLGPYDALTLVKGMFYPLFILWSFLTSVPLLVMEHAAYLLACAGVAKLLTRTQGAVATSILFGLLAFNPVFWDSELNRVIREGLYVTLSLGCLGLTVATVFPAQAGRSRHGIAVLLGLAGGAFWLTREEGVWLLPALGVVVAAGLMLPGEIGASRRGRAAGIIWQLALGTSVAALMVFSVAAMNWAAYGVFLTTEFQSGAFPRAYGALARITPDMWRPYVVFPADAQARAYAVSPAAAELAPVLDGPRGLAWAKVGCTQTATTPCPGILSGWFMWALRDAADSAGHHRTARDAQRFYRRLAREINAACDDDRLPCGPANSGLAPPFRWEYLAGTARSALRLAELVVRVGPDVIGSLPSQGWPGDLAVFADIAGPIARDDAARVVVWGWAADVKAPPRLIVAPAAGQPSDVQIGVVPLSDPANEHPDWVMVQFQVSAICSDGCNLVVAGADGGVISQPMSSLTAGTTTSGPGPVLHITSVSARGPAAAGAKFRAARVRIAGHISALYRWLVPPGLIVAALGVAGTLIRFRRSVPPARQLAFACAALVAVLSRIMLLAYLDATSIPSVNYLYASPASPFVIGFAFIGCLLGWSSLRRKTA